MGETFKNKTENNIYMYTHVNMRVPIHSYVNTIRTKINEGKDRPNSERERERETE